jgi:hypothetical protein
LCRLVPNPLLEFLGIQIQPDTSLEFTFIHAFVYNQENRSHCEYKSRRNIWLAVDYILIEEYKKTMVGKQKEARGQYVLKSGQACLTRIRKKEEIQQMTKVHTETDKGGEKYTGFALPPVLQFLQMIKSN